MTTRLQKAGAALLLSCSSTSAGSAGEKARFLTPQELAELGDKSKVSFATKLVNDPAELPILPHPGWSVDGKVEALRYPAIFTGAGGSRALGSFECTPRAMKALEMAEPLFQKKEYDSARAIYESALGEDPGCYLVALNAGDCYLFSGKADRALHLYDQAIKLNPADFHGHWFRGSALVALGRAEDARLAYSQALAMSPKQPNLLAAIRSKAYELGIDVRDEPFQPSATAGLDGKGVTIYTVDRPYWWIYGVCRGIWLAEESHRVEMTGEAQHRWTNTEDLECLGALLTQYKSFRDAGKTARERQLDTLLDVRDHHLLNGFAVYEFGSRVSPNVMLLLPETTRSEVADYVRTYVLRKIEPGRSNLRLDPPVDPVTGLANDARPAPGSPAGQAAP